MTSGAGCTVELPFRIGAVSAPESRPAVAQLAAVLIAALALLWPADQAWAQACATTGINQTCTNPAGATVSGGAIGIDDDAALTVTNFGTITGSIEGIRAITANVTNSGTIDGRSFDGIRATTANVTNSGTISGGNAGINATNANVINSGTISGNSPGSGMGISAANVNITNSGTISGGLAGIVAGAANVTNSGTISSRNFGIRSVTANVINSGTISSGNFGISLNTGEVTNSGTIIGERGTAIAFTGGGLSDTLTVLPGARFGGLVNFGGGADTVNFGPGSWILYTANFNAALSQINTSGMPYWVTPNSIVVANTSSFGAVNRAMLDITNWISSVLPDIPVFEPPTSPAANAFAAIQSVSPRIEEAFAQFPGGAMSYAPATPVFKGGAVQDAYGNTFWAKGFAGRRDQDTTGNFVGAVTTGYGGAIGYDHKFNPAFQLGGFVGMSNNKTNMDLNLGSTTIDTAFGGGYVRALFGAAFLDLSFTGGQLDNTSKRNIGGGLNLETASANYGGWFVNPAAALGVRYAIANGVTLTPAIKVRYLKSQFDSYTETGSSANLTVAGWDSAAFEERAELSLASVQYFGGDQRILFRMTGGALAQQRQGDSNIGLTFAGQQLFALAPDQRRVNGWYGSAGFDWQRGNFAIFAAGEMTDTNDAAVTYSGKGGLRLVW